jgi:hypothetical protein
MSCYTCFDWFKKLRLFSYVLNLKIYVILKAYILWQVIVVSKKFTHMSICLHSYSYFWKKAVRKWIFHLILVVCHVIHELFFFLLQHYWKKFLNNVIVTKTNVLLLRAYVTIADCINTVKALWLCCSQRRLNILTFLSFNFERTWLIIF